MATGTRRAALGVPPRPLRRVVGLGTARYSLRRRCGWSARAAGCGSTNSFDHNPKSGRTKTTWRIAKGSAREERAAEHRGDAPARRRRRRRLRAHDAEDEEEEQELDEAHGEARVQRAHQVVVAVGERRLLARLRRRRE